jgi:hypothetical protein
VASPCLVPGLLDAIVLPETVAMPRFVFLLPNPIRAGTEQVVGPGLSEEATRREHSSGSLAFVLGSGTDIPAEAGSSFDLITCFEVLEHPKPLLRRFAAVYDQTVSPSSRPPTPTPAPAATAATPSIHRRWAAPSSGTSWA